MRGSTVSSLIGLAPSPEILRTDPPLAHRAPKRLESVVDTRPNRRGRYAHDFADLLRRESLVLAQEDRRALLLRELGQHALQDPGQARGLGQPIGTLGRHG